MTIDEAKKLKTGDWLRHVHDGSDLVRFVRMTNAGKIQYCTNKGAYDSWSLPVHYEKACPLFEEALTWMDTMVMHEMEIRAPQFGIAEELELACNDLLDEIEGKELENSLGHFEEWKRVLIKYRAATC